MNAAPEFRQSNQPFSMCPHCGADGYCATHNWTVASPPPEAASPADQQGASLEGAGSELLVPVDDAMVERACIAYHPENWARAAESSRRIMRYWMRNALSAALASPTVAPVSGDGLAKVVTILFEEAAGQTEGAILNTAHRIVAALASPTEAMVERALNAPMGLTSQVRHFIAGPADGQGGKTWPSVVMRAGLTAALAARDGGAE